MNADQHATAQASLGDRSTRNASVDAHPVHTVHFSFDSSEIRRAERAAIDARIAELGRHQVKVIGYTDAIGPLPYNQRLALRRAQAVAKLLASNGIAPSIIEPEGRGRCCYVAPNDTAEGRARNRRAEIFTGAPAASPHPNRTSRSPD